MKIMIIENGKTDYVIAVPENCSPVERSGARELQDYLCKALRVTLPILPETAVAGKAIQWYSTRMYVTGKDAPGAKMLDIYVRQDETVTIPPKFYREDLQQGGYHLYHIGKVKDIPKTADTRLFVLSYNHTWVNLSGIAVTFPMEACDIYLSMKFTGSLYGGRVEDENAIYLERMILVRE